MKLSRTTVGLIVLLLVAVNGCPQLLAQEDKGSPAPTTEASTSAKIEELQKELDSLKAQIEQLKKTQEEKKSAPASASTPVAATTVAAVTEAPTAPTSKPTLAEKLFNSTNIS